MSDSMSDRLGRFTPNAPGLDRDAILFAAGRQSARGSRVWKLLAAALFASQVVTLIALWPSPASVPPPAIENLESPALSIPQSPASPQAWTIGSAPDELPPVTVHSGEFVSSGPSLSVRSYRFD